MKFIPITEFTDQMWYESYLIVYNKDLAFHMGVNPQLIVNPPTLIEFHDNIMSAVDTGVGYGFGVVKDDELIGHIILDKRLGEWEGSVVLKDKKYWNSGIGVRAALRAGKWVFEEQDSEWVMVYAMGKDPKVKDIILRTGFRPFMGFYIMDRKTWDERWSRSK